MSSESESSAQTTAESATISKKQSKKEAAKAEKLRRKHEEAAAALSEVDMLSGNYGEVPTEEIQSKTISGRKWTEIGSLTADLVGKTVFIRGSAQAIRAVGKKMTFLVLRQYMCTVQCVLTVNNEFVSAQMVKFANGLSKESIVDIEGIVSIPKEPIKGTTQQVEVQVRKLYCINRAVSNLPINIEDAARSEKEFEKAELTGEQLVRVGQDTRLNYRVLDLRTPANQAIFRIQCQVENEAGVNVDPLGDLNTENERKLGHLVLERYNTEFYILRRYPLAVRPFYTMPCYDDPTYSNSFDVFIRGEEIISGAQRIHSPELLTSRAEACGIDVKTISTYIDSFRYGAPPHGGFGVGLERVVMLFCALNNIRKTSLFPRDPQRLVP